MRPMTIHRLLLLSLPALLVAACGGGAAEPSSGDALAPMDAEIATTAAVTRGSVPSAPGATQVVFSGHVFHVRTDTGGPGPNTWSAQNVWVDAKGQLHLKISNQGGQWSCAEVYSDEALGFGTYQFKIAGHPETLDDNIVLGLFNYPTPDIGPDGTNEIDIEFATWGGAQPQHGNWTVWPAAAGPSQSTHSFNPLTSNGSSTHKFVWSSKKIQFGAAPAARASASWTFAPANSAQLVPQHAMPLHMNFWLFQGNAPVNAQEAEIVVASFTFTPAKANK